MQIDGLSLKGQIEALLFASPKPLKVSEIRNLLNDETLELEPIEQALGELLEEYAQRQGGFHLVEISRMGYQFQTVEIAKPLMERQFASRPRPISRAALETLAVIAYRQKTSRGVTRAEIEFIRGVDVGSILKNMLERGLVACVGRKEIAGRPMMFAVTEEFLKVFQLGSVNDLPPLESFQTSPELLQQAQEKIDQFLAEEELELKNVTTDDELDAYTEVAVESGNNLPPGSGEVDL